ncbi:MAG: hypothetical protein CTY36_03550 [Methylocystis sp.]|nr:MAG: hypothetical protein CTY36_03550 [Methylocystis sp.]
MPSIVASISPRLLFAIASSHEMLWSIWSCHSGQAEGLSGNPESQQACLILPLNSRSRFARRE